MKITRSRFDRYEGKKVRITKKIFDHSVYEETITGKVEISEGVHAVVRNGIKKIYPHHDYYIIPDKGKAYLLEWNKLKLITRVEVIKDGDKD